MRGSLDQLWWPVPGWEGLYEVSDQGRVRSLDRWVVNVLGHRRKLPSVSLLGRKAGAGYLMVTLCKSGVQWREYVHRLVLLAFVGPCPDGCQAAHGNGILTDNRLENLRWTTIQLNHADKRAHGTHQEGEKAPGARLTAQQAIAIYRQRGQGHQTAIRLAAEYGCTRTNVLAIWRGKSWRSVTGAT